MPGIESEANSMSTTGPMTRAIRPTLPAAAAVDSVAVAVMSLTSPSLLAGGGIGERVHASDDLADFLGNTGLTGLVGDTGELLDQLFGVVRGGLHRLLAGGELGGRGLQQGQEDAAVDVLGKQRVQHLLRTRLELVERQHLVVRRLLLALDDLERQQPHG